MIGRQAIVIGAGMGGLAAAGAIALSFERLVVEVQSLLKSRSVYREPALVQRVMAIMAQA